MEKKICIRCKKELPESSFYKNGKYYRPECKECAKLARRSRYTLKNGYKRNNDGDGVKLKLCNICGNYKTLDNFYQSGGTYKSGCKSCVKRKKRIKYKKITFIKEPKPKREKIQKEKINYHIPSYFGTIQLPKSLYEYYYE